MLESLLNEVGVLRACNFIFSCEICKLFKNRGRNSQARSILCSYGNQVETSLSSCRHGWTHLRIHIAGEVEKKEKLKNLFMFGKFSFHDMVDRELFTYVKNKKKLTLVVNKKFKIVNGAV